MAISMSSREIAELTGKEHKNVLADVRKMLDTLEIQRADFSARYLDEKRESRECFNLPKDLTFTLVLGYDVRRRYAVTRCWLEVEKVPSSGASWIATAAPSGK